jgi:isoleucyl-tRNA synthetase
LLLIRTEVLKSLEEARGLKQIGAPLEAKVVLESCGEQFDLLQGYQSELPALFITSEVELKAASEGPLRVTVLRSTGVKCDRCWKYTHDVGVDSELPSVCVPCAEAVREIVASRQGA